MFLKYFVPSLLIALFFFGETAGATDSYTINSGQTVSIDEFGVCKDVANSNTLGIMVPTKTANEWHTGGQSFLENLYTGVSAADCSTCGGTVNYGGQSYNTVEIGTQCWFQENLNIGTMLASSGTEPNTGNGTIEKWCYNNSATNCTNEGGFYNWTEATKDGYVGSNGIDICPVGWHMPTDEEYKTLEMYLGMSQAQADVTDFRGTDEGTKLKAGGTSGFEGILPGYRHSNGNYYHQNRFIYIWSATAHVDDRAWRRFLVLTSATVNRHATTNTYGFSVRFLRD